MIKPRSFISEHGMNSSKFAILSPLSPHIYHDVSGIQRVDPLQTLYKRNPIPPALSKFLLFMHLPYLSPREKSDLTIGRSLASSPWSHSIVSFFLFRLSNYHWNLEDSAYWFFKNHQYWSSFTMNKSWLIHWKWGRKL